MAYQVLLVLTCTAGACHGRRVQTIATTSRALPEAIGSTHGSKAYTTEEHQPKIDFISNSSLTVVKLLQKPYSSAAFSPSSPGGWPAVGGPDSRRLARHCEDVQLGPSTEERLDRLTIKVLKDKLKSRGLKLSGKKSDLVARLKKQTAAGGQSEADDASRDEAESAVEVSAEIERWNLVDLKARLKASGLKVSGKKADLIARLKKHTEAQDMPEMTEHKPLKSVKHVRVEEMLQEEEEELYNFKPWPKHLEHFLLSTCPDFMDIEKALREAVEKVSSPKAQMKGLLPFGSAVNGFGTKGSDLDLSIIIVPDGADSSYLPYLSQVYKQDFLRNLVTALKSCSPLWTQDDVSKLSAKVPVVTLRYADRIDVDLAVNPNDIDVLRRATQNFFFLANLQLKEQTRVADLWHCIREDFTKAGFRGPNLAMGRTLPTRFNSFCLILILLEFMMARGSVGLDEQNALLSSPEQLHALQKHSVGDLLLEFYTWCSIEENLKSGVRKFAWVEEVCKDRLGNMLPTLHVKSPWHYGRDYRVQYPPIQRLLVKRAAKLRQDSSQP